VTATLTDNALQVLRARYLARENGIVVETPDQLFRRVARHISAVESGLGYTSEEVATARAKFERMMSSLEFVPNSPTLMNAGRPLGQLAACFVVPVDDSTTGVFEAAAGQTVTVARNPALPLPSSLIRPFGSPGIEMT
jgi:ribonucleoside-diphosphate reductase alpha chain